MPHQDKSMNSMRAAACVLAFACALSAAAPARSAEFADVLDTPAQVSPLASRNLLLGVAQAGDRLVAVGQRGHIVVSADGGATWTQSPVPVSSDLTSVWFVDATTGWAVGHDGVILHSDDGGAHWKVQLDGRRANELLVAAMESNAAAQPESEPARALLDEAKRFAEQGPDKPFLDVWFADRANGFAVGAYNMIFATSDGGENWVPWFDRTDNPKLFNLHAVRPVAGDLWVVGEAGVVLRLDREAGRFVAVPTPYEGSFFGLADAGGAVLVYGLRGNVFRSGDRGATWVKVDAGLPATVVAAARTGNDAMLLADVGGRVVTSTDGGVQWTATALEQPMPLTGLVAMGEGRVALVGPRGAAATRLKTP
jgi:photosystem II stability/assembly factor-like uncharacterized protein